MVVWEREGMAVAFVLVSILMLCCTSLLQRDTIKRDITPFESSKLFTTTVEVVKKTL